MRFFWCAKCVRMVSERECPHSQNSSKVFEKNADRYNNKGRKNANDKQNKSKKHD